MTCDQTCFLLNALADREMNTLQTWRIRRHLAACPACAAQLADIQRLDTSVQSWRDVPASANLGARIAALHSAAPDVVRRPLPIRPAAVGLASVAAALIAFLWFLPGQPGRPAIAFADVERAMANVNIIDWTDDTVSYGKDGIIKSHRREHVWMRRNPPVVIIIIPPQPSEPQGRQSLEDKHGTATLLPNGKIVISPYQMTVYGTVAAYNSLFTRPFQILGQEHASKLEPVTLNQRPAFKTTLSWHFPQQVDLQTTLWVDPATKRLLLLEARSTSHGKLSYVSTDTQMRYDGMPPPGILDIVSPLGAKVGNRRRTKTP